MKLTTTQKHAYRKLLKYNNSFIFWTRQSGKTYLLTYFIENFVQNNKDKDILFIIDDEKYIRNSKKRILDEISKYVLIKIGNNDIRFINNNFLRFCTINYRFESTLIHTKPDVIIYDEFIIRDLNKIDLLIKYIEISKCKCIFTSTYIDTKVIKALDYKNNYYINILPFFGHYDFSPFHRNIEYDHKKIVYTELSYKPDELLDYRDIAYERMIKLKRLNEISNGR